jgi:[ribosomal protein S5]-alanine N-acetyltransferase
MSLIPALVPPLIDGDLTVRAYAERDIPEILIAFQDDPTLHTRIGLERPPSGAQLGSQSEAVDAERIAGERLRLTIAEAETDVCRGRMTVHHFDWDHGRAELGMWLAPEVRGRGWAVRALRLVAPWLIEVCGIERVELLAEPDNEPMLRAAEAAGFVREGVLRAYVRSGSDRLDLAVLSFLPESVSAE